MSVHSTTRSESSVRQPLTGATPRPACPLFRIYLAVRAFLARLFSRTPAPLTPDRVSIIRSHNNAEASRLRELTAVYLNQSNTQHNKVDAAATCFEDMKNIDRGTLFSTIKTFARKLQAEFQDVKILCDDRTKDIYARFIGGLYENSLADVVQAVQNQKKSIERFANSPMAPVKEFHQQIQMVISLVSCLANSSNSDQISLADQARIFSTRQNQAYDRLSHAYHNMTSNMEYKDRKQAIAQCSPPTNSPKEARAHSQLPGAAWHTDKDEEVYRAYAAAHARMHPPTASMPTRSKTAPYTTEQRVRRASTQPTPSRRQDPQELKEVTNYRTPTQSPQREEEEQGYIYNGERYTAKQLSHQLNISLADVHKQYGH